MILFDNNNSKNYANDFWILKLYRPNEKKNTQHMKMHYVNVSMFLVIYCPKRV